MSPHSTPAHLQREPTPTPVGTEAARAFYQSRIWLFFTVIAAVTLIFFVLHNCLEVLSGNLPLERVLTLPLNLWHLAAGVLASALALLTDKHTVTALDAGETDDGTLYIVMELLTGESLFERYKATTIGDILKNCYTKRLYAPESCGDIRDLLNGVVQKHVFAAVAGSIPLSIVLVAGAWALSRRRAPSRSDGDGANGR